MSLRNIVVRVAWLPILVAALLLVSALVADSLRGRVRLDAQVLALSRGSNPNNVLNQSSCGAASTFLPCNVAGDPCVTCAMPSFVILWPGPYGGYTQGMGFVSCGVRRPGVCMIIPSMVPIITFGCPPAGFGAPCATPNNVIMQ